MCPQFREGFVWIASDSICDLERERSQSSLLLQALTVSLLPLFFLIQYPQDSSSKTLKYLATYSQNILFK